MNIYDLIIFLPLTYGMIRGLFRGFVKELVSLISIVIAFIIAETYSAQLTQYIQSIADIADKTAVIVAYLAVFVGSLIIVLLFSNIIHSILKAIKLIWLNSLFGAALGALKWVILIGIALNVFEAIDSKFHFANQDKKEQSVAYYSIQKIPSNLWEATNEFYQGVEMLGD